ncbi:MAG: hypothetical protein L6262_01075 [Weeksellaceae bacterium]|nr:hypothetical protein [Weeksellaceae bacterium]
MSGAEGQQPAINISFDQQKNGIQKATEPIAKSSSNSRFSIRAALEKREEIKTNEIAEITDDSLPSNHFSQTDLDTEWSIFVKDLSKSNTFAFNAINSFKLEKTDENLITVKYSSAMAKLEFDKLSREFFNHFKHKVSNFKIEIEYVTDLTIKKEVMTKRKMFEKFVQINPVLKDLDDLMKFDLT